MYIRTVRNTGLSLRGLIPGRSEGAHTPLEEVIAELRFHEIPKARGEVALLDSSVLGHCLSLAFREIILHRASLC